MPSAKSARDGPSIVSWEAGNRNSFSYKFQVFRKIFLKSSREFFHPVNSFLDGPIMRFKSIAAAISLAATVCGKEMAKDAARAARRFSLCKLDRERKRS